MIVIPARPRHLPDILRMIRALSAFHGDEASVTLEQLQQTFFASDGAAALVAVKDEQLIGYAGLTFMTVLHTGVPRVDIHHLFVDERHRAQGVGQALIAAARDHANLIGAARMSIGTDLNNHTAQSAYRAMGLEEITEIGPRFTVPLSG